MGQVLHWGLLQGREPVGVARLWVWRLVSTVSWRRFAESDRGRFDEEVLGGWIQGEEVEAFSKDPFESVEAWIISSGEGKSDGCHGRGWGWCWSDKCFWIRGTG